MRYRLTCLTPVLVGDGRKLSPIDYMVWKDHVNVLDQQRIFKLLAKGPRLEGYLQQLKRADKLDFASWGGFAQNYADRRVPFESASSSAYWDRAQNESLFIPTFSAGPSGPYLPGAAIKGALRTGVIFASAHQNALTQVVSRINEARLPRRPAELIERADHMRSIAVSDSRTVSYENFRVYLLRTSTLNARGANSYTLGWKQSPRGAVDAAHVDDSTPTFAEMAAPGSMFEGEWIERKSGRAQIFEAVNKHAEALLALHRQYAQWTGLKELGETVEKLAAIVHEARARGGAILAMGWGGGLLTKTAFLDTTNPEYRQILQAVALYNRAASSSFPFPKTRRIVFEANLPSSLPGWAVLEVA